MGGLFKQQFVVYAISRQGIEQIGSSFGFIFPSFSMKVPWEGAGGGGGDHAQSSPRQMLSPWHLVTALVHSSRSVT